MLSPTERRAGLRITKAVFQGLEPAAPARAWAIPLLANIMQVLALARSRSAAKVNSQGREPLELVSI
jgi:hypothetical protein